MSFLPTNFEKPTTNSLYMKFEDGDNRFRIVSPSIFGYEYWTANNKPVRMKKAPTVKPADVRINDDGSYSVKPFLAFAVIDRADLGGVIKILEITQKSIMADIEHYVTDADWGEPTGYDIVVTRKGKGMETRYTTMPKPATPLTPEEQELIKKTKVNLEALFVNEDPFKWEGVAEVEDDLSF
jgi:hypothetical protein